MPTKNYEIDDSPDTPSVDWLEYRDERQLCADLMAGTKAMRERRDVYTPRKPGEEPQYMANGVLFDPYLHRVNMGSLNELFGDTVRRLARMPFKKDIKIDGLPAEMEYLLTDADGQGTPLSVFAQRLFEDLLAYGVVVGNVDYSRDEGSLAGEVVTRAEAAEQRQRARFQRFPILSLREHAMGGKSSGLVRVRLVESRTERVEGKIFADESVPIVRHYEYLGERDMLLTVYRYDKEEQDWFIEGSEPGIFPSDDPRLPMTVIGSLQERPPLFALAQTNLRHYQSDLANIHALEIGRFAIFLITGLTPQPGQRTPDQEQTRRDVYLAPSVVMGLPDGQDAKFVETTGAALDLGLKDVARLEDQAERQSAQPLARETGVKTATGVESDEARTMTPIQQMVGDVSMGLTQMFRDAAAFSGISLPSTFSVKVFSDFGQQPISSDVLRILLEAVDKGKLRETRFLEALQAFGALEDDVDLAQEVSLLASEAQERMDAMMERMDRQPIGATAEPDGDEVI